MRKPENSGNSKNYPNTQGSSSKKNFHVPDLEPPVRDYGRNQGGHGVDGTNNRSRSSSNRENRYFSDSFEASPKQGAAFGKRDDLPLQRKRNVERENQRSEQRNENPSQYFHNFDSARNTPPAAQSRKKTDVNQKSPRRKKPVQQSNEQFANREEMRKHQNARRKKAIKRRRIVIMGFLALCIAITAIVLSLTVFFKINKIEIIGDTLYTQEQILSGVNFKTNDNLFMINASKQEEALQNWLPYIKTAEITRSLPGTIKINIVDNEAKYIYYLDGATSYLMDEDLKILERKTDYKNPGLIVIEEAAFEKLDVSSLPIFVDKGVGERITQLALTIKENKIEKITSIKSSNESTNFIVYDGRITIKLGNMTNLKYKIQMAQTSIAELDETTPGAKGVMDVTVDKKAYFTEDKS